VFLGVALGLAPGLLGLLIAGPFLDAEDLTIMGLFLFPAGVVIGLIGGFIARDRTELARFKDYAAGAGTVSMRLRPANGTEAFRRALGVSEEPEREKADSATV
jgi:hypothetical protein